MSLYRDTGVVLRVQKLGEADRIITFVTQRHGKVRAVAKGVRRTTSRLGARVESGRLPLLPAAVGFAREGIGPGAIARNLASFGAEVAFADAVPDWLRRIMADAQTSGGLLAAVAPEGADDVLARFRAQGFASAAVIGRMQAGASIVSVSA